MSRLLVPIISAMLATVSCALAVGPGPQGPIEAVVCEPSWSIVPSSAEVENPQAIEPIAPDDIWIVGNKFNKGPEGPPAVATTTEHWDGNSWTAVPTPNLGDRDESSLNGADALRSADVWAVGYSGQGTAESSGVYKTLVEHWNGTAWSVVPSPNVGGSSSLTGVDAVSTHQAWAVGYSLQGGLRKTLIQRWNGTSWSIVPSPNPGTLSNALLGVAVVGPDDVWAVGYQSSRAGYRSLVLHYDGTAWREVDVPAAGTGDNVLTSISAIGGNDIWTAGYYIDGTQHRTLTLHYNGTAWKHVPSANDGDSVTILRGIGAFSSGDAWSVGFKYRADRTNYVAATQHWNGTAWTAFPSAISQTVVRSEMRDVDRAPGTAWVWAAGRPANVESICPATSATAAAPARETEAPAASRTQVSEQSSSTLTEASNPEVSVAPAAVAAQVDAVDKARDAGISEITLTRGPVISDFNNDGLPDIFLGRHQQAARLYINSGNGSFRETNQGTFGDIDRHGCDAGDVNNDKLEDIFCTTGAAKGSQIKHNELYIQRANHTFVEQTEQYGVLEPFARGRSAAFIRANGDAFLDLFSASEPDRADGMPSPNRLFINEGGSAYRYAPEFGLERDVGDGSAAGGNADVGDLDKDGWQDLVAESKTGLRVYHNNRGNSFTDVAASVGLGQKPVDSVLSDVNGDTWRDVIEVSRKELRILLNTNGTFSSAFSTRLQGGIAVAAGDVNGDDRPDIYVMRGMSGTSTNAPDLVYLNSGTGRNFTKMSSIPSTSQGQAESVTPIDYDGNGLTDFLALNGNGTNSGPVQLIAFFPVP